jgi:hypothetical protein
MNFLKKKISRIGHSITTHKVIIKPISLELELDTAGEVWIEFKRGKHKECTQKHHVEAGPNVVVRFGEYELLVRGNNTFY